MLIESLTPMTIKLPGGDVQRLIAGQVVDLPDEPARKLLERAPGKVRVFKPNWLEAWRSLAAMTKDIFRGDPRFEPVMTALGECDRDFERGDWVAFQRAAKQVRTIAAARVTKKEAL